MGNLSASRRDGRQIRCFIYVCVECSGHRRRVGSEKCKVEQKMMLWSRVSRRAKRFSIILKLDSIRAVLTGCTQPLPPAARRPSAVISKPRQGDEEHFEGRQQGLNQYRHDSKHFPTQGCTKGASPTLPRPHPLSRRRGGGGGGESQSC